LYPSHQTRSKIKMEKHKIENFLEAEPGRKFPTLRSLSTIECMNLKARLAAKLGKPASTDSLIVLQDAIGRVKLQAGDNAEDKEFDLMALLSKVADIKPTDLVYLNWYRFDRIDEMKSGDLASDFFYIWYPGPDDIEIFDDSLSWLVSISHSGTVRAGHL